MTDGLGLPVHSIRSSANNSPENISGEGVVRTRKTLLLNPYHRISSVKCGWRRGHQASAAIGKWGAVLKLTGCGTERRKPAAPFLACHRDAQPARNSASGLLHSAPNRVEKSAVNRACARTDPAGRSMRPTRAGQYRPVLLSRTLGADCRSSSGRKRLWPPPGTPARRSVSKRSRVAFPMVAQRLLRKRVPLAGGNFSLEPFAPRPVLELIQPSP